MFKVQIMLVVYEEGRPVRKVVVDGKECCGGPRSIEFVKVIEMPAAPVVGMKIYWDGQYADVGWEVKSVEWDCSNQCYNVDFEDLEMAKGQFAFSPEFESWGEEIRYHIENQGFMEHYFASTHKLCCW